jgi:hypothetical protein
MRLGYHSVLAQRGDLSFPDLAGMLNGVLGFIVRAPRGCGSCAVLIIPSAKLWGEELAN